MSGNKVKGFFKGIKYITKKFESEKEAEIQIGAPTDVKHVAHIGGDGPSVNPPSWMSDSKGEGSETGDEEGSTRELSELPRPSSRERSEKDKSRSSRRSSRVKDSDKSKSGRGSESINPDKEATKKHRRKKAKDQGLRSGSSRSATGSDLESESESKYENDRRDE